MMSAGPWYQPSNRGHLEDRVLGEQRNQLVHVVRLERRDVLRELILRLNRIRLGDLIVVGRLDRVELRTRALQQAVDRRRRRADGFTDLGRLPLKHLTQHEHRALPGRQMLKGGHERQPHRLAGLDDHRRVGRIFFRRIGQRLEPGDLARSVMSPFGFDAPWPSPDGSGLRCLPSSAVRLVFVAMR